MTNSTTECEECKHLQDSFDKLWDMNQKKREQIKIMRESLEFYADNERNWQHFSQRPGDDMGRRAQEALRKIDND